jgi:hypothetical protein
LKISTKVTGDNIQTILEILQSTPTHLAAFGCSFPDEQINLPLSPGEWSLDQIMVHLVNCAQVYSSRIYYALLSEDPILPKIHPQKDWSKLFTYEDYCFTDNLTRFKFGRQSLLRVLDRLEKSAWQRTFNLDVRSITVNRQARTIALHEMDHIEHLTNLDIKGII